MLIEPDFTSFSEKYHSGVGQLVYMRQPADLLTPISAYLKLAQPKELACLFESVESGRHRGRYSAIALNPISVIKVKNRKVFIADDVDKEGKGEYIEQDERAFTVLKSKINEIRFPYPTDLPPLCSGLFGYMSYETVHMIENLPSPKKDSLNVPDMYFFVAGLTVVFDTLYDDVIISCPVFFKASLSAKDAYDKAIQTLKETQNLLRDSTPISSPSSDCLQSTKEKMRSNLSSMEYMQKVDKAREYILAGDIFQVVLSQRFTQKFTLPAFQYYRSLRRINPSPYLFYFDFNDFSLAGSSPEILVNVTGKNLHIRPIAGTRRRGKTAEEDSLMASELLADPKECAEHLMLLDLGRNDAGRVAKYKSVNVTEKFTLEYYSKVMHIVSHVTGELAEGKDVLDALRSGFPAGTVSGAPKVRAMEIINELESEIRGPYAGAAGYFSSNGDMDTCIILRTALIKDNLLHIQAGAGIVLDSQPELENEECQNKASALDIAAKEAYNIALSEC